MDAYLNGTMGNGLASGATGWRARYRWRGQLAPVQVGAIFASVIRGGHNQAASAERSEWRRDRKPKPAKGPSPERGGKSRGSRPEPSGSGVAIRCGAGAP